MLLKIDALNRKAQLYLQYALDRSLPIRSSKLQDKLKFAYDSLPESQLKRVDYYNQLENPFLLTAPSDRASFTWKKKWIYRIDLHLVLRHFPENFCFLAYFGDRTPIPPEPTFYKARPICDGNQNSVLMRLNSLRHFNFVNDPTPFAKKSNTAIWRGKASNNPLRQKLLTTHHQTPRCDFKNAHKKAHKEPYPSIESKTSIAEQLTHKFLVSIEGNDVATNTKWILNSNSLCFMPLPTKESWFMEGTLIPGTHFVPLEPDFSDLEEKIDHYAANPDEAEEIIRNANAFCRPFKDRAHEELIGILVAAKYAKLCLNNKSSLTPT